MYTIAEYQTLLEDTEGWYDPKKHQGLFYRAYDKLIEDVGSDRMGEHKTAQVTLTRGVVRLPADFIGSRFTLGGMDYEVNRARLSSREMKLDFCGDGAYCLHYRGLPEDENGECRIPDSWIAPLIAQHKHLVFSFMYNAFRVGKASPTGISYQEVQQLRGLAVDRAMELRGSLEMPTPTEAKQTINRQVERRYASEYNSFPRT